MLDSPKLVWPRKVDTSLFSIFYALNGHSFKKKKNKKKKNNKNKKNKQKNSLLKICIVYFSPIFNGKSRISTIAFPNEITDHSKSELTKKKKKKKWPRLEFEIALAELMSFFQRS